MTEKQLLEKVKTALNITGEFQDNTLLLYIQEVQSYLLSAGVSKKTVQSEKAVGVITRGVADLWQYGSGSTNFSSYFLQRAIQLCYERG